MYIKCLHTCPHLFKVGHCRLESHDDGVLCGSACCACILLLVQDGERVDLVCFNASLSRHFAMRVKSAPGL